MATDPDAEPYAAATLQDLLDANDSGAVVFPAETWSGLWRQWLGDRRLVIVAAAATARPWQTRGVLDVWSRRDHVVPLLLLVPQPQVVTPANPDAVRGLGPKHAVVWIGGGPPSLVPGSNWARTREYVQRGVAVGARFVDDEAESAAQRAMRWNTTPWAPCGGSG